MAYEIKMIHREGYESGKGIKDTIDESKEFAEECFNNYNGIESVIVVRCSDREIVWRFPECLYDE